MLYSEIILPPHAPPEYRDRATLWNAVEHAERHKKAQLAYSFDIALQNELTMEENIELARGFVQKNFVGKGMVADLAIHQPDKGDGGIPNPHFHVLTTMRPINPDGTWGQKQKREYLVDKNGDPVLDSNGKPKFNAVATTDWHCPETLEAWRKAWCDMVNEAFERNGITERIDHRSYERQNWTILHEIGHVVLDHNGHGDREEAEADFFAKYAIAPPVLIHKIKADSVQDIYDAFDISLEAAEYAFDYYRKWRRWHLAAGKYTDYENALLHLYEENRKSHIA